MGGTFVHALDQRPRGAVVRGSGAGISVPYTSMRDDQLRTRWVMLDLPPDARHVHAKVMLCVPRASDPDLVEERLVSEQLPTRVDQRP